MSNDSKSLFDNVLGQDGLICGDVGWWSKFMKGSDGVENVDIGLDEIMEDTCSINQVDPSHGASIGSFVIVVDGGRIPCAIDFSLSR